MIRLKCSLSRRACSRSLAHKSDVGGVLLNIADESALRRKWNTLHDNINRARPELTLDGVLVERMGERGVELVVGARRDPQWGPVVMVGLGGVLVEALGDVRLLPPTLSEEQIVEQLQKLKGAKLLNGFRGLPAVDVPAVARVVALVSRLMVEQPQIVELDVNPLVAHSSGVVALDALIVTRRE
jgi:acetate---CoA ligase (ADP-forming)